ncbi:hypothetical protein MMC07_000125 [Pseudocyphellaria aurata]|nr:hypothetical protein [Pseudocyphellaria aurata]
MRSSSSDEDEVDALFPSANEPPDAQNQPRASNSISELSPPASQDHPDDPEWTGDQADDMDVTDSHGAPGADGMQRHVNLAELIGSGSQTQPPLKDDYRTGVDAENAPGYAWMNKKAREEQQRALEQVVDRGFNLREFGDIYDDSSMTPDKNL